MDIIIDDDRLSQLSNNFRAQALKVNLSGPRRMRPTSSHFKAAE